jgi:hypothetical protein
LDAPVQAYFTTFGEDFETYAGKCLKDNESYEACPNVSPPPSPPPPGVGYTCIANMAPLLNALALAQEDATNVENAIAMCGLAQGYYGNYCMNDPTVIETVATNPTLYGAATSSTVNAGVSANCATGGIAVRAHTPDQKTQHETCASNYDDYQGKCYVVIGKKGAGATPTAAEVVACCTAANVMAQNECPCVNVAAGKEAARVAAVNAQQASDVWRGQGAKIAWGPSYAQKQGINDESYDSHFDTLAGNIKSTHDTAQSQRKNAVSRESDSNIWRGVRSAKIFDSSPR